MSKPSKRAGAPVEITLTDEVVSECKRVLEDLEESETASEVVVRGVVAAMVRAYNRARKPGCRALVLRGREDRFERYYGANATSRGAR